MDLNTMAEQWKQKVMEHILEDEVESVNFLFLTRQDVEIKGQKRGFAQQRVWASRPKVYTKQTTMPNTRKREVNEQTTKQSMSWVRCSSTRVR